MRQRLPNLALLRHADRLRGCPFIGVERKCRMGGQNDAIDPTRSLPAPKGGNYDSFRQTRGARSDEVQDPEMASDPDADRPRVRNGFCASTKWLGIATP